MGWYARELGYGDEAEFWSLVGLLHDLDFEQWPEEHCVKCQELLKQRRGGGGAHPRRGLPRLGHLRGPEAGARDGEGPLRRATSSPASSGRPPSCAPPRAPRTWSSKSLKKKFKDKKFAAGCSRDVIAQGAELLGWELDKLLELTLRAMQEEEDAIEAALD